MDLVASRLRTLLKLERGEGRPALLAALGFFLALFGYSMLRPLRDAAGLAGGTKDLPWLFAGTLGATLVMSLLAAEASRRTTRRRYTGGTLLVVAGGLLLFRPLLADEGAVHASRAFYVWVSVVNLLVVSVWFSFLADQFRREQALRLYGLIGVGGTLGALLGAATTGTLVGSIGTPNLLLVSAACFALALPCALAMPAPKSARRDDEPAGGAGPAWEGLALLPRRPLLLGICAFTFSHTFSGTFLYFLQAEIVGAHAADRVARTELFATIDTWTQGVTLALQLFVAGRWLKLAGPSAALAAQPVASLCAGAALWWALGASPDAGLTGAALPVVTVLVVAQVVVRATHFASARPVREALYVPLPPAESYKAKAAIDTFVYRGGDALGAWLFDGFLKAALGLGGVALLLVPLGGAWCALSWLLGRSAQRRDDSG